MGGVRWVRSTTINNKGKNSEEKIRERKIGRGRRDYKR